MQDSKNPEVIELPLKNRVNAFLWFFHRATGIVIIIWMIMHTFTNFLIIQGRDVYEQEVLLYHNLVPQIEIFYALLGAIIAWHALYGLTNIIRDLSARRTSHTTQNYRENPMSSTRGSSSKNIISWFKFNRDLPTRPLWSIHRISALIILFTVFIHFVWIHLIGNFEYYSSWNSVVDTFKNPAWMLFYLLFDFGVSFHGTQGIRIILTDFTSLGANPKRQNIILTVSLLAGIIGFLILAYIDIIAFLYVQNL